MAAGAPHRYWRIAIASALITATVFTGGRMVLGGIGGASKPLAAETVAPALATEGGPFRLAPRAPDYQKSADVKLGRRPLKTYYERRAYAGAPPTIPHRMLNPSAWGGASCLGCHRDGGYTPEFKAMAPVTPHPELAACVQCHVPAQPGAGQFRRSTFTRLEAPEIGGAAMPGSPPRIPHDLQMRSNCLACHGGPAAVNELRTTHPQRVNCRQCHALNAAPVKAFARGGQ